MVGIPNIMWFVDEGRHAAHVQKTPQIGASTEIREPPAASHLDVKFRANLLVTAPVIGRRIEGDNMAGAVKLPCQGDTLPFTATLVLQFVYKNGDLHTEVPWGPLTARIGLSHPKDELSISLTSLTPRK